MHEVYSWLLTMTTYGGTPCAGRRTWFELKKYADSICWQFRLLLNDVSRFDLTLPSHVWARQLNSQANRTRKRWESLLAVQHGRFVAVNAKPGLSMEEPELE